MSDTRDYYEVLGIRRTASPQEIKKSWLYWVNILHTDRMLKMPEHIRIRAEEDLKKVNEAYETLSDPGKRSEYDKRMGATPGINVTGYERARAKVGPKVEIYPAVIYLDSAKPRAKQRGTFFIRNAGGNYHKVLISNPEKWIKITRTESLYPSEKLPMRVDIEVTAPDRGKTVGSEIRVRVDEAEASVRIELSTRAKR
jgi:curved DNA-binding protein CbpA